MTKAVDDLLDEFKERFGKYHNVAHFDQGKGFYNFGVRDLWTKNNIEYFSTNSERKAAIVERFNRILKTSMWKYFYSKGTHTWIDVLDDLTDNYNHSKHRTIMIKPADVNKSNKDQVWITLYGYIQGDFPIPKFKVDDTVRISKYKNIFDKGYLRSRRCFVVILTCTDWSMWMMSQLSANSMKRNYQLSIRQMMCIVWKRF